MSLQRDMGAPGVQFSRVGGQIVWTRVIDASSSQGPRPATPEDAAKWPGEWNQFVAREQADAPAAAEPAKPARKTRGPNKPKPPVEADD